jgi:hypothetical protein
LLVYKSIQSAYYKKYKELTLTTFASIDRPPAGHDLEHCQHYYKAVIYSELANMYMVYVMSIFIFCTEPIYIIYMLQNIIELIITEGGRRVQLY